MAKEEISKTQIRFLTNSALANSTCHVLALAFGKMTTGGCKCCDFHLPIKPRVYYSHSMCLLRDLSPYDSMMGLVR